MYMLRIGRDSDVSVELTPSKGYIITNKDGSATQCENIGAVTYLTNAMRSGVKIPNKWFIDFQSHVIGELVEKIEEVTTKNVAS